jgi:hypothetical protein
MSSNASKRLEAWLVFAGMLAAMGWYAKPQLVYSLTAVRHLVGWLSGSAGN